jgi:uncharacterized protein (DUF849 family)/N-acetylglutamate synthase-like GNAT family acetyltransferase
MAKEERSASHVQFPHPLRPYPKLIINAALTGVVPTRRDSPHVPISVEEVIEDAVRCCDAGAAIVHVHARDAAGRPTYEPSLFAEIIEGIRRLRPELIICATTSGRRYGDYEQRSAVLELDGECKPDMASLTTGSLNFPDGPSVNAPDIVRRLAERMQERGVKPELEILELGMVNTANVLISKGIVQPPYYFNILLGSIHTAPATMLNLCAAVQSLPSASIWSATGLGRFQLKVNVAAVLMGGHVRVGLEDNLFYDTARAQLATNAGLVERLVRIASELERPAATPDEARETLGLPRLPGCVVIERATEQDVPQMMELLKLANMHRIPSEEMPELDWRCFFVAREGVRLVGLSGYKILSERQGKTTLMVVHPDCRRRGLGMKLQAKRLNAMARRGVKTVTTNADLPATIEWYKKHFGYRQVGTVKKVHEFGDPGIDQWTTLEMDLKAWTAGRAAGEDG